MTREGLNRPLVLQLSLFGLAMGILTVFVIPPKVEPVCWLVIFVTCAVIIAKRCDRRHFVHGLCVSLLNSIWITAAHVVFLPSYLATHPDEAAMMKTMPVPDSPRLMMIMTGPIVGFVSGVVLGIFCLVAGKIIKPSVRTA